MDTVLDSGVVFLLNHDVSDWYVFMNVEDLTRQDAPGGNEITPRGSSVGSTERIAARNVRKGRAIA